MSPLSSISSKISELYSSISSKISQLNSFSKNIKEAEFSRRLIPSDVDFMKFVLKYDIILAITLFSLKCLVLGLTGIVEILDFNNFKLSKVTFRQAMGNLAKMMSGSLHGYANCNIYLSFDVVFSGDKTVVINRGEKEIAMLRGFLALVFLLMNLLGFFWGVLCLPVSPPFLFLVHQFIKWRNVKESRDKIALEMKIQATRIGFN